MINKRSITELTADDIEGTFGCGESSAVWVTKENDPDRLPFEDEYKYTFNKPRCIKDTQEIYKVSALQIYPNSKRMKEFYELKVLDKCTYVLKDGSVLLTNGVRPQKYMLVKEDILWRKKQT